MEYLRKLNSLTDVEEVGNEIRAYLVQIRKNLGWTFNDTNHLTTSNNRVYRYENTTTNKNSILLLCELCYIYRIDLFIGEDHDLQKLSLNLLNPTITLRQIVDIMIKSRVKRKWSQAQVARNTKLTPQTIGAIELLKNEPTVANFLKLAAIYSWTLKFTQIQLNRI